MPVPGPGQVRIRMHASGVCGTDIHVWYRHFPVNTPQMLELAAKGKVKPKLETYPLEEVNRLMERQRDGLVRYRGVLTIDR